MAELCLRNLPQRVALPHGELCCRATRRHPGLTGSNSRQRSPPPRLRWASFQRESPAFTVNAFNFAVLVTAGAMAGRAGALRTAGGCEGRTREGAGNKSFGRSKGDRLTSGRKGASRGGAALETGGRSGCTGGLGEASAGASAKGRRNSADC